MIVNIHPNFDSSYTPQIHEVTYQAQVLIGGDTDFYHLAHNEKEIAVGVKNFLRQAILSLL